MSSCIVFSFHKGHNITAISHQGKAAVICLDCQVMADIEAIGGHISPADACISDPKAPIIHISALVGADPKIAMGKRVIRNQISEGITI